MKIRIRDRRFIRYAKEKLFTTKHIENMLLILIHLDRKETGGSHFKLLTSADVMRAFLLNNEGGKVKEKVSILQKHYQNNELVKNLKEAVKSVKIHNIVETIKEIKKNYDSFFTKIKNGDKKANPPKPKRLKKVTSFTLHTDSHKSFTFYKGKKRLKNKIGLNLNDKMVYTHVRHDAIEKVTGSVDLVRNIRIHYNNGTVYLEVIYAKESVSKMKESLKEKVAGLDVGVNILAALWIEDELTPSLLLDGSPLKNYNATYNRFRAKLSETIDRLPDVNRKERLFVFRRFLTEKRKHYFFTLFHQYSKRILEYCCLNGVTKLVISRNLADLKYNGECETLKKTKQSFIQIPFLEFLTQLEQKASQFGIEIEFVNEAYTSKTSSLSKDVLSIQEKAKKERTLSTNDFGGGRVKRGLFKDKKQNVYLHADCNGARNIAFLGGAKRKFISLTKYRNPLKFKSDLTLCRMIQGVGGIRESVVS